MTVAATSPFDVDEIALIRSQLPATYDIAYLNAGTLGPLPLVTIEAIAAEQRYDSTVRHDATFWDRLQAAQHAARAALVTLTGMGSAHVALMHSTHEGMNACLWGLDVRDGDNVVTTDEEHPGLLIPLRHVRDRTGVDVRVATWKDDDEAFVASILSRVDARTRAVALSHVSWVSGRVAPLRGLREALPHGVRVIVDGAQSAGVYPIDASDGWDAYSVSGQKWPCGPNGSGGLALADPEAWRPTYGAYMQLLEPADFRDSAVVADGRRLEMSQEALVPLVGFAASVGWIAGEVGITRAHAHARACNAHVRRRLTSAGVEEDRLQGHSHLLCIDLHDAPVLATSLYDAGFLVRSLSDDRLRLSFGCWNTVSELDRVTDSILSRS